jgi:hypothetical protein
MHSKIDNSEKAVYKYFKTLKGRLSNRCSVVWNKKYKGKDKRFMRNIKRSTKNFQKQDLLRELYSEND